MQKNPRKNRHIKDPMQLRAVIYVHGDRLKPSLILELFKEWNPPPKFSDFPPKLLRYAIILYLK